jgi:hypothetical protein
MSNATIISNLETLLEAVEAQPEALFALCAWKQESECGTILCVAGLACTMPEFQAQGMRWNKYDTPSVNGVSVWNDAGDELFGCNSMKELFHSHASGLLDATLGFDTKYDEYGDLISVGCTDKELAIARLKHRIATYKENM